MFNLPLEVVFQEAFELRGLVEIGTGGDEGAAGQPLVEVDVVAAVQLVDRQLPDRVAAGRALAGVSVASVRHSKPNQSLTFCIL